MKGIVLNEGGTVTYPYEVFKHIEKYVKSLNWRITNAACGGGDYVFPFEEKWDNFIDGETLYELIKQHSDIQWWWGSLSGFPKEVPVDEVKKNPVVDLQMEQPYLKDKLHHLEPLAVFELIAFDSTETYVLVDSPEIADLLYKSFPNAESLEKYVYTD